MTRSLFGPFFFLHGVQMSEGDYWEAIRSRTTEPSTPVQPPQELEQLEEQMERARLAYLLAEYGNPNNC